MATIEDIRAISWLAENARDPVVVDCSYQALAGIHLYSEAKDPNEWHGNELKKLQKLLEPMFPALLNRFEATIRKGRDMAATRGANLARFARAMVELSAFLGNGKHNTHSPSPGPNPNRKQKSRFRDSIRPRLESLAFPPSSVVSTTLPHMEIALGALDEVWRDEHPPFSADSYACLTAAELRLVALNAIFSYGPAQSDIPASSLAPHAAIDILPPPRERLSIVTLRNTYYRGLARASIQLRYHSDARTPIGPFPLINLLDALRIASKCPIFNSQYTVEPTPNEAQNTELGNSFSRPRSEEGSTPKFIIPVFSYENYVRPTDLSRGPLGSIIRVLASTPLHPHSTEVIPDRYADGIRVRFAAVRALAALAPVLLQRWFIEKVSRVGRDGAFQEPTPVLDVGTWPEIDTSIADSPKLEGAVASQLLLIIRVVGAYIERAGAMSLVELSLAELNRIADTSPFSAHLALRRRASQDFAPLLKFASADVKTADGQPLMNETTKSHILNLLTFDVPGRNQIPRVPIPPESLPLLLRIAQDVPHHTELVRSVLKYVVSRVRETRDNIDYLRVFTHSNQGYALLVAIGRAHEASLEPVVSTILQITYVAAGNAVILLQDGIAIGTQAIPGLLDAISLVVHHTNQVADKQNYRHLHSLGRSVISTLQNIGHQSARMVLDHNSLNELIGALQAQRNQSHSDVQSGDTSSNSKTKSVARSSEYLINQLQTLKSQYLSDLVSLGAVKEPRED
ncbi:hypothetical protein OPQ81_005160 [Rhizoctonia solani]|nr:hypothetical protein OPQ81_005160 [Rhizoctonia solani]